ncbi:MAG: hypothetical protein K5640_07630 [Treponema sp.]|nr:hypothetical protein [Treponema sp.]
MKKTYALFVSLLFVVCAAVFAQESYDIKEEKPIDTSVQIITPKNIHSDIRTATVKIEYTPMVDEVRIYYACLDVQFDESDAMNSILACLKDFQAENQYFGYKYLSNNRTRFYKDSKTGYKMAQYYSYVKFYR